MRRRDDALDFVRGCWAAAIQEFGVVAKQWMGWRPRPAAKQVVDRWTEFVSIQQQEDDQQYREYFRGAHLEHMIPHGAEGLALFRN